MPAQYTYPGVYVQELASGAHTVVGVATSIGAFAGWVKRGPVGTAAQIFNWGDYERIFGGLDGTELGYAAYSYYLNGGAEAYVTRVVDDTAEPAWTIAAPPKTASGPPLTAPPAGSPAIWAASPGTWGNAVYVYVDYGQPAGVHKAGGGPFNLRAVEVTQVNGAYVARSTIQLGAVSLTPGPTYVVDQLANFDNPLIAFSGPTQSDPTQVPPPVATGTTGGVIGANVASPAPKSLKVTLTPAGATKGQDVLVTLRPFTDPVDAAIALKEAFGSQPSLASAQVQAINVIEGGYMLRVVLTDFAKAGYILTFGGDLAGPLALSGTAVSNVQAYRLGSGLDGAQPAATDLIGDPLARTGVYSLEEIDLFNLLSIPDLRVLDEDSHIAVASAAAAYCQSRRAMMLVDLPQGVATLSAAQRWVQMSAPDLGPANINAAAYWPEPVIPDPMNKMRPRQIAVSGVMAGVYAKTDNARGVWKAPAGVDSAVAGVLNLAATLTDAQNGTINPLGLNAMRTFPIYGTLPWGGRTLAGADALASDWKYVPVRRTALYIEESLYRGLKWAVFEPNGALLWSQIRLNVAGFMQNMFQQGAFAGVTRDQAYQVKCDASTTSSYDIDAGVVNIVVRFAPLKPAEFVVLTLQQITAQSST